MHPRQRHLCISLHAVEAPLEQKFQRGEHQALGVAAEEDVRAAARH